MTQTPGQSPNKIIARMEQLIQEAGSTGEIICMLRIDNRITLRENAKGYVVSEQFVASCKGLFDHVFHTDDDPPPIVGDGSGIQTGS